MIELVAIRFEGVIARVAPSLVSYFQTLPGCQDLDLARLAVDSYASGQPWRAYLGEVLSNAGVPASEVLEIVLRSERALSRSEAWNIYPDAPVALAWLADRQIPVAVLLDWPIDMAGLFRDAGVRANATAYHRSGSLSDFMWQAIRVQGIGAGEVLYVASDLNTDFEDARSLGCRPLVMDRAVQCAETVPGINHLVELELYI